MLAVILNFVLEFSSLDVLLSFGVHDWNFDLDHVVLILEVHLKYIIHFEIFAHWRLVQDFELAERYQVALQVGFCNLHVLHQVVVGDL